MIEVLGQMWWVALLTFLVLTGTTLASLLRRPRWGAPKVVQGSSAERRSERGEGSAETGAND